MEGKYSRAVRGLFQKAQEGAELARRCARGKQSAAGRGHVPDRHAIARLPRAACGGGAFRRRPAHRARLDAGGVPSDGADRQALQVRSRQGSRDCRPCRRWLWLQGQPRHGDDCRDRACARRSGAGAGRLRSPRRAVGDRLSACDGSEDRAPALRAGRFESAVAHRLCRHGRRDQFHHRRTRPPDLSGRRQGARRSAVPAVRRWPLLWNRRSTKRRCA
jgi:hypothetical protein